MYKIVFLDIDGTLLNSRHRISAGTLAAVQTTHHRKKIPVILTSARPPQAMAGIYQELQLDSPAICFNGALITARLFAGSFSTMQQTEIDPALLKELYALASESLISISFYTPDQWLTPQQDEWIAQEEAITGTRASVKDIGSWIDHTASQNRGPNKIMLMAEPERIDRIEPLLQSRYAGKLGIYRSKPAYLEILDIRTSKQSAIQFLLDHYGFTSEAVMAIGDNYNDMEMLQAAGLGIAMGNAPPEVREKADFVTLDNDSDGVRYALEQFT